MTTLCSKCVLLVRQDGGLNTNIYLSPFQIRLKWICKSRKRNVIAKSEWGRKAEWTVSSKWSTVFNELGEDRLQMGLLVWQYVWRQSMGQQMRAAHKVGRVCMRRPRKVPTTQPWGMESKNRLYSNTEGIWIKG